MNIYEDRDFFIEIEQSSIPWLKIFTKEHFLELSDMPLELYIKLFTMVRVVEIQMLEYYNPKKINIASFANMLPRVHIHIMARFENDSHFPNPMWGEKLRESNLVLPSSSVFVQKLIISLKNL